MHIELNIRLKEIVRRTRIVRFVAKTVIFCLMMYSRTAAQVLLSPTLVSPPDSATNQPTTVLLQWDTLANATNYEVQLSTDPAFNTIVVDDSNVTTVTKQVGPLQNSTTYYWRVRAEYVLAWSAWSSVSNFTTVAAIPSAPVLVNPPNGATNQPTSITFSWNSSTGASSYHFQVSADVGFSTTIIDQPALAATSFAASGLAGNTTYFWRVSASNSAGTSGWSTVSSFSTTAPPPPAPALLSPSSGSQNNATTLTLSWNASPGASSYTVQIASDSSFASPLINQSGIAASSFQASGLANNTTYYWRVSASNAGGTSGWSPFWIFSTVPVPPASPLLSSPANQSVNVSTNPALAWSASSGATSYSVQVSTDSGFTTRAVDQTGIATTSFTANGLAASTKYFWRVAAINSGGSSPWSTIWNFTTIAPAPVAPTLSSPASGSVNQPTSPTLAWNASTGASNYRLQVSTDSSFAAVILDDSTLSATTRFVGSLSNGTTYYWRVNARNSGGSSPWSSTWNFTTIVAGPSAPTLASPTNGSANQPTSLTLTWNAASGASNYRLQVSADSTFGTTVLDDSSLTTTSRSISSLSNSTRYYWRVNARNTGGTSPWSPTWSFTTIVASPSSPTLASPANGTTNQPTSLTLSWNTSSGATNYRLQVSPDSTFATSTLDDSTITTTSRAISSLANGSKYFWRVDARNSGGTSSWSPIWNFTTVASLPGTPTLASPANGSTNQPTSLTLNWNTVSGASSYQIQVSPDTGFATKTVDQSGLSATSYTASGLANNTAYYWRVNATNGGGVGPWSSTWQFTTVPAVPATPVLSTPANAATNQPTTLTFGWSASTGASSYHLQVASDTGFVTKTIDQSGVSGTTFSASGLANGTTYYWRVNAVNAGGTSPWSTPWTFTTIVAGPSAPTLASPTNGSANQPTALTLSWNGSSGASNYRLQVSADSTFGTTVFDDSSLATTSRSVSSLSNSTKYYWRVNARNTGGTSPWSSTWNFSTIIASPASPALASPANGSANQPTSLTLSWNVSSGASNYRIQVSADSAFNSTILDDSTLTTTSRAVSSLANSSKYFWRVDARNSGGTSSWSSVWSFTTIVAGPSMPILASPANGSANQPTSLTLGWNASSGASNYRLQVSADSTFGTTVLDDSSLTTTSRSISSLSNSTRYYWRVNARNIGGTSPWSSTWGFTTIIAGPTTPTLASPANGSTNQSTSLTLTWNASTGSSTYRIQLSADSTFATTVLDDSTLTTTSRGVSSLANNTKYFWRVLAQNAGGTSPWSAVWNFTTIVAGPSTPVLVSPPDSSVNQPTSVTFSWNSVSGATSYRLQISPDAGFTTVSVDQSLIGGTSYTVNGLADNTAYFWRVNATNAGGTSPWSAVREFSTVPSPPAAPVLASPADGATNQPTSVTLSWNSSSGTASYAIQVATDTGFTAKLFDQAGLTATSYTVTSLANNTRYYWRVNATNAGGTSPWSLVRSFVTMPAVPPAPTLSTPADSSTNQATTPTLSWNATSGASSYHLQISSSAAFASTVVDQPALASTSFSASGLSTGTTYFWRVSASNAGGTGPWSATWSFSTVPAAPAAPTLVSPSDSALNQPTTITLTWNIVSGASAYHLQVSATSTFASTISDQNNLTSSSSTIAGLANGTSYYWRVAASNAGGTSAWSAVRTFITLPPSPQPPLLSSPADKATGIPVNPTLAWNPSSGATSYRILVSTNSAFSTTVIDQMGIPSTSYTANGLSYSTTYFWKVNATNAGGTSDWSVARQFTTVLPPPTAPTLVTPTNGATNQPTTLTVRWSSSAAGTYRLQVARDSLFTSRLVDDSALTTTSRTLSALPTSSTLFWRVQETNGGGTSGWSSNWSFATVPNPPPAPILAAPSNGTTNTALNPVLTWNAAAGASTYRVEVSTSSAFSSLFVDDSAVSTTSLQVQGLSNNVIYFWRVSATNTGGTGPWSATWSFTTIPAAPAAPVLASPVNAATNQPTSVSLAWNAASGASTYGVQLSDNSAFTTTILNQSGLTSLTVTASGLANGITYYWRVNANNAGGTSAWSIPWSFTTVPAAPAVPTPTSPPNGATGQPITLNLSWSPSTGAATYRLQVSKTSGFSAILFDSTMQGTSSQVGPLAYSTSYFWRVNAQNAGGTSNWSTVFSFTTVAPTTPPGPVLLSPPSGSVAQPTTLTVAWNAASGATGYQLEASTDPTFGVVAVNDSGLTNTSAQLAALTNSTTYYWRVRSFTATLASNWSSVWNFATVPPIPSAPVAIAPANGSTNVSTNLGFSWNVSNGASSYRLQVSPDSAFSTSFLDQSGITGTSFSAGGLALNTTYYWRLNATNAGGTSAWSTRWSFTTLPPPPGTAVLASPANGTINTPTNPVLHWNSLVGASSYRVQISTSSSFTTTVVDDAGITSTSDSVTGMANNTIYYWRVTGSNAGGTGAWSAVWNFTTVPLIPASPTLASPSNGASNQPLSVTLVWNAPSGAGTFRLQVSPDPAFSTFIVDRSGITSASQTVNGLANSTTYYWRVNATNAGGTSSWSNPWKFSTLPPLPEVPVLASPSNGMSDAPLNVTVQWNTSTAAASYALEVSQDSTFSSTLLDQTGISSTFFALTNLGNSTAYFWRVSASNPAGSSAWSTPWKFMTVPATPSVPALVSPVSGTTNEPTTVTMTWNALPGVSTYRIQISDTSTFAPTLVDTVGLTSTSYTFVGARRNTTYSWRVSASNAGGTSGWSSAWSFTTIPIPPPTPSLSGPPNGVSNQPMPITLAWNPVAGATSYWVQVSPLSNFASNVYDDSTLTSPSVLVSGLKADTNYYWHVSSRNPGGSSPWSSPWKFGTASPNSTTAGPTLSSPPNGSTHQPLTPTLQWNAVALATSYELQASSVVDFSSIVYDNSSISSTSQQIGPLSYGSTYYWRVRASVLTATTQWSDVWSFSTILLTPSAPVLSSPADSATGVPVNPTLAWNPSSGATVYHVQVSRTASFNATVVDDSSVSSVTRQIGPLGYDTVYYWRVQAGNSGGWSQYSTTFAFTTTTGGTPAAVTNPATNISATSALLGATVNPNGNTTFVQFQYGTTTSYGTTVSAIPDSLSGSSPVNVSLTINGLDPGTTYYFRVVAANSMGTTYGAGESFTTVLPPYPASYTLADTIPYPSLGKPSEYKSTDYRMIGLPGAGNIRVSDLLGGSQHTNWEVYWDNGAPSGNFVGYSDDPVFQFSVGRAFWVINRGPIVVSTSVASAQLDSSQAIEIPLHAGWNLITNPTTTTVSWSAIQTADSVTEPIYGFDGSFAISGSLKPYTGYYFFNRTNLQALKIPYRTLFEGKQSTVRNTPDWKVQISVSSADGIDRTTWIGVASGPFKDMQTLNYHKPSGLSSGCSAYFSRPQWDARYSSYASDIRPAIDSLEQWEFNVQSAGAKPFEIRLGGVRDVPAQYRVYLIDDKHGRYVDLRSDTLYRSTPESSISRFVIAVGLEDAVQERLSSVHAPRQFDLGNNYPNPFNPSTVIPVELPATANVTLTIYNILGQKIRTLHTGVLDAGRYSFTWDGQDDTGLRVSSGVYLYRFSTNTGYRATRKMIMLK